MIVIVYLWLALSVIGIVCYCICRRKKGASQNKKYTVLHYRKNSKSENAIPQKRSDTPNSSFNNLPQWNFGIKRDIASDIREQKAAGKRGEIIFDNVLKDIIRPDDTILSNISITYNEQKTELDFVIINRCGIFVIEVKNYSGTMYGGVDDFKWEKTKTNNNIYTKCVQNPVRQVKREVYILKDYLKSYGINVWISGYVYFVRKNSPITDKTILASNTDIDHAIHQCEPGHYQQLDMNKINQIKYVLEK